MNILWTDELGYLKQRVIDYITFRLNEAPERSINTDSGTVYMLDGKDIYFENEDTGGTWNVKYEYSMEELCSLADDLVSVEVSDTTGGESSNTAN